jgi:hypothetical protein
VQTAWRAIRRLGVTIIGYLDDSCLLFPKKSYEEAQHLLDQSIAIFQKLGYIVSPEKSTLHPVQRFSFLGLEFNTQTMEVAWPDAKRMAVRDQLQKLLKLKETTPRRVAHTVGALKAAAAAFPSVHLLTFNVQRALAQSASSRGWDNTFALPPAALEELKALHRLVGKPEQIWEPLLLRISKRKLVLGPEALVPSTASQELPPRPDMDSLPSGSTGQLLRTARAPSTWRKYDSQWAQFAGYCTVRNVSYEDPSVQTILDFLTEESKRMRTGRAVEAKRSALRKSAEVRGYKTEAYDAPLVRELIHGAIRTKPSLPRPPITFSGAAALQAVATTPTPPQMEKRQGAFPYNATWTVAISRCSYNACKPYRRY